MRKGEFVKDDERRKLAEFTNYFIILLVPGISSFMRFIGSISLLLFVLAPLFVEAGDMKFIPKLGLYGGYDDNILFERGDKLESFVVNVQPKFELNYSTLLSMVNLRANWDILQYINESELDRVNQDYQIDGTYTVGQRWNTYADFRYLHDTTLNSYLEAVGRVVDQVDRDYFDARAGASYSITTVSYLDGQYKYEKARYEDNIFPNYSRHQLYLYYKHLLKSSQDSLSIGPSYYHRINDFNTTDSISLDFGWERDWSKITNTFAAIGARYANEEDKSGDNEDGWGAVGRFNLTRLGTTSTIKFEYYHDLDTPVDGNDVNVDNFYLRYDYLFTQRFGLGIDSRLIFSYDLFHKDDNVDNSRYFEITPNLSYRITETLSTHLRYRYQHSSQDLFDSDEVRKKKSIWIEFQYEYPMML